MRRNNKIDRERGKKFVNIKDEDITVIRCDSYSQNYTYKNKNKKERRNSMPFTSIGISFLSCKNLNNYAVGFYNGFVYVKWGLYLRKYQVHS